LIEQSNVLLDHNFIELSKCFKQDDVLALLDATYQGRIDIELREIIYNEIRSSIPLDKIVQLKDERFISDKCYGMLAKISPLLRKILPKPYHTVVRRRYLDSFAAKYNPQETKDGISLDPELVFLAFVKKYYDLNKITSLECCISLDARPIKQRGKNESQTVVGFKYNSQSPNDCFKQSKYNQKKIYLQ
jgi:hypothetical protein